MKVKLHKGQQRIWNEVQAAQKIGSRHFICAAPRQYGKTFLFTTLAQYYGTRKEERKYNMLWVGQTLKNSRRIFEEIIDAIGGTKFVTHSNKQDLVITFNTGNKLYFAGAEVPKSIRGGAYKYLFLDEFAHFYDVDNLWNKILRPVTLSFRGDAMVFMISTPKGRNLFYELANRGKNKDKYLNYSFHTGVYTENPFVDIDEIKQAELELPSDAFRQEYLAEFLDVDMGVFRNLDFCSTITAWEAPQFGDSYYAGIDVGRKNDQTVLTILNSKCGISFIWASKPGMQWDEIVNELVKHLKRYRVIHGYCETNSQGDVIYGILKKIVPKLQDYYSTNSSKKDMIESLQYAFDRKEIRITKEDFYYPVKSQLSYYEKSFNGNGKVTYNAPYGRHDDHCISLALAHISFKRNQRSGNYIMM